MLFCCVQRTSSWLVVRETKLGTLWCLFPCRNCVSKLMMFFLVSRLFVSVSVKTELGTGSFLTFIWPFWRKTKDGTRACTTEVYGHYIFRLFKPCVWHGSFRVTSLQAPIIMPIPKGKTNGRFLRSFSTDRTSTKNIPFPNFILSPLPDNKVRSYLQAKSLQHKTIGPTFWFDIRSAYSSKSRGAGLPFLCSELSLGSWAQASRRSLSLARLENR